uniref:Ribosomal protein S3 n=1 Tax=Compsopogon caeruleus TaxID=31354 RepID=A0A1Z1XBF1_9RHOD|nr:ribosomal protein S3 [Compsopogon caeruleus]ARX96191.1 ribosomal protein S3 [Compsopogon caeruleus]
MSQKVNPIGFRLGVLQIWNADFQCYGKLGKNYSIILYNMHKITTYLTRIFKKNNLILGPIFYSIKSNIVIIDCFYVMIATNNTTDFFSSAMNSLQGQKVIRYSEYVLNYWFANFLVFNAFKAHWLSSPLFLATWITTNLKKCISIKKIFLNLEKKLLRDNENLPCIKYSTLGENLFILKGIKIICSGRLRGKRNRMSNKMKKQVGIMPLQTINTYIDYKYSSVFTRFGKFGIRVYYYYEAM